jgi:hypothetical protein
MARKTETEGTLAPSQLLKPYESAFFHDGFAGRHDAASAKQNGDPE